VAVKSEAAVKSHDRVGPRAVLRSVNDLITG
jgi:hypothetical protein